MKWEAENVFVFGVGIFFVGLFFITFATGGSSRESLQDRIYELEEENSMLLDCVEAFENNAYSVRSALQIDGNTYEDLYYAVDEAESMIEPKPYECDF